MNMTDAGCSQKESCSGASHLVSIGNDVFGPNQSSIQALPRGSSPSASSALIHDGDGPRKKRSFRQQTVPLSVTPIACINYDSTKPVCRRCSSRMLQKTCHHELHAQTVKEQMLHEIQGLRRRNEHLEEEKEILVQKHDLGQQILSSIQDDGQEHAIINGLRRGYVDL